MEDLLELTEGGWIRWPPRAIGDALSDDEQVPGETEPDEGSEEVLEPAPGFGEQQEAAQADEWEEDAREGGG